MPRKLIFTALVASLAVAAQAAPATADKGDPMKKICKKQAPPIGSRLGATRICATAEEWKAKDDAMVATRKNFEKVQQQRALIDPQFGN
jgi:hypothetical protein